MKVLEVLKFIKSCSHLCLRLKPNIQQLSKEDPASLNIAPATDSSPNERSLITLTRKDVWKMSVNPYTEWFMNIVYLFQDLFPLSMLTPNHNSISFKMSHMEEFPKPASFRIGVVTNTIWLVKWLMGYRICFIRMIWNASYLYVSRYLVWFP